MNLTEGRTLIVDALPATVHKYRYGPRAPIVPAAFVLPAPFKYDLTFGGEDQRFKYVLTVLAASVNTEGGQDALDALISPNLAGSLVKAMHDNAAFAAVGQITDMRSYGIQTLKNGQGEFWAAELLVDVFA